MIRAFLTPKNILKILISLTIIWVLYLNLHSNTDKLVQALRQVNPWVFVGSLIFYLFCQYICAIRWQLIANDMNLPGGSLEYFRYYLMGMFFGLFLPTAVGGDVAKGAILSRAKGSTLMHALLSMIAERLAGLISLLAYVVLAFNLIKLPGWSVWSYVCIFALFIFSLWLGFNFTWLETHPWTRHLIARFVFKKDDDPELKQGIWPRRKAMFWSVIVSLVFHAASIAMQLALMNAVGIHVGLPVVAAVYGLSGLASMIPAFGGIGPREGAIVVLLNKMANIPVAMGTAYSIVWLGILLLAAVPGGLLLLSRHLKPTLNIPAESPEMP